MGNILNKIKEERTMKELKPRITENGIEYVLVGDYYIPDLKLPEENRPIGKYGQMHREYLKEQCYGRYSSLLLTGKLWSYLEDLDEQAEEPRSALFASSHLISMMEYCVFVSSSENETRVNNKLFSGNELFCNVCITN